MADQENNIDRKITTKRRKRIIFYRWLLAILLLPIFLSLIIQIPYIQKLAVDYFTSKIEKRIDRNVEIEKVYLDIFDGLRLEKFLIEGITPQDTLISFDKINISLSRNILTIFNDELDLQSVELTGSRINVTKAKNETRNDVALLLDKFFQTEHNNQKKGSPLELNLGLIGLEDITYQVRDLNDGAVSIYRLPEALIELDSIDLEKGKLKVQKFYARDPFVKIIRGNKDSVKITTQGLNQDLVNVDSIISEQDFKNLIEIYSFEIENGTFVYQDQEAEISDYPNAIDLKNFALNTISINADSISYHTEWRVEMDLKGLSFIDNKGFSLENFASDNILISEQTIDLPSLIIKTPQSNILSDFSFVYDGFDSFSDFVNKVYVRSVFNNATMALDDLIHFVPKLNNNAFFAYNNKKVIKVNGTMSGFVNNLASSNLQLRVNDRFSLSGSFGTINLTDTENALVNLKVDELKTSMNFLRDFIPSFTPPQNFYKLGNISFNGRFDGYFEDFVAYGNLETDLGNAALDMRLDVKQGNELANYSGQIRLVNFELGRWSDNQDLEKVSLYAEVNDGEGLTLSTAVADLQGEIDSLTYKDYQYKNVILNGTLEKNQFNGEFSVSEEHIDLNFTGEVSYKDSVLKMDLAADIVSIDLETLNLSKKLKKISGNINANITGTGITDLVGVAHGQNIIILSDSAHYLDTFSLFSYSIPGKNSRLQLMTDIGSIQLVGEYNLNDVVPQMKQLIKKNYPYHTRNWKVNNNVYENNNFVIDLEIIDSKRFFELAGVPDLIIKDLRSKGIVDSKRENFNFDTDIGYIEYKENILFQTDLIFGNSRDIGFLVLNIDSSIMIGKKFNPLYLESDLHADTLSFTFSTENILDSVEMISIIGNLTPDPNGYRLSLEEKELVILGKKWTIFTDNAVVINSEYISVRDLLLSDGYREIEIQDIANEGLSLVLRRFNFLLVNELIDYDKIDFSGEGEVNIRIDNILGGENYIQARMFVEDFRLNEESYGSLDISFDKDLSDNYVVLVAIDKGDQNVKANFEYDGDTKLLNGLLRAKEFPLDIFEKIIPDGISETKGRSEVEASISGPFSDLKINGEIFLSDCGVKIDYLGTSFFMDDQIIKLDEHFIDFTGNTLTDAEGNIGSMTGGLRHDYFKDFRMFFSVYSDNAVMINTTRDDNPLYYGKGEGQVKVDFTGGFESANFAIDAITKEGTILNIPVEYATTADYEESFITFVNKEDLLAAVDSDFEDALKIEGVNVEMNLTMTEDADVRIIFNEKLGDVIEGNGRGDIQISVLRTGEFEVFGDYTILDGQYLFTARNIVAKPFTLRRGGKVRWTGDPINAELDIKADYLVRTPLYTFLSEFQVLGSDAASEASNTQNVNLILDLKGTLFAPKVNFDLEFPDLVGELNSYAESKLRTLKTNEVALNSQVFGLLVANRFLPDNNPLNSNLFASDQIVETSISTLGEFVTSQASRYVTSLLQAALSENSLIAGIDFQIGLTGNSGGFSNLGNEDRDIYPDEISLNLRNRFRFWDERLSLGAGVNYVRESPIQGYTDYYIPNIVIEYYLTDDRNLKLRLYGRRDVDEININDRRDRIGLGLGYRKEFGSISDVINAIKSGLKVEEENQ